MKILKVEIERPGDIIDRLMTYEELLELLLSWSGDPECDCAQEAFAAYIAYRRKPWKFFQSDELSIRVRA